MADLVVKVLGWSYRCMNKRGPLLAVLACAAPALRASRAPLGLIPQPKENYAVRRHRGCVLLTGQVQILMTPQIPRAWRGRLQAQVRPMDGDLCCFASAIE